MAAIIANQASNVNPWSGLCELIIDANITGNGWYVVADPAMAPTIVYGYVAGTEGPQTRTEIDFDSQSIKVRSGLDFGAGVIDFRGAHHNPGV